MKTRNGFSSILLIVVGLIVIGGGYFVYSNDTKSVPVELVDKSSWVSYQNTEYNFFIKFPKDIKFSLKTIESRGTVGSTSTIIENSNSSGKSKTRLDFLVFESTLEWPSYKTYRKTETFKTDNLRGEIRYYELSTRRYIEFASPDINHPEYDLILGPFSEKETEEKVETFKNILGTLNYN